MCNVLIYVNAAGEDYFFHRLSSLQKQCMKKKKSLYLREWVEWGRGWCIVLIERHSSCYTPPLWCGIPWSRKTKHEVCLILHRVPWGQGVSLLPSWRLWVLYNSIHRGPASHSPVINKWAAMEAEGERWFPLSCHHTCFHSHRARLAPYEGWLVLYRTPGKAILLSCLVCLIIQEILTTVSSSEPQKQLLCHH